MIASPFPLQEFFHRQPVGGHTPLLMAGSPGWTEPATAGHAAAGDAQGRGSGQVWARGTLCRGLGAEPCRSHRSVSRASWVVGWHTQDAMGLFTGGLGGLSQVQVGVATHPAGPEVHSLCPGLYPDAWVSDPLRVPGESQPEFPTDSSIPETCQAQEAA